MQVRTVTDAVDTDVFTANVFLAPAGPTLIDAGAAPEIVPHLRETVDELDAIVVTHSHGDHVAVLDDLLAAFDADCYAAAALPGRTRAVADGDTVPIGDESCTAIATPGHADDHLAFVSERVLFSGDVVVYEDDAFSGGSFGRTDRPGQSRERLIESLTDLLGRLPATVDTIYPGHGPAFEGDVRAVIERARERAKRREPKY
ncbi:MBL fold metallo-hydrolase [Halobacteriales archaeon SW_7_68_16]|nr:MAG: MBL fold metallo-hydrolase [Halobacteriales archaeon SW_7_68_16]